jgi:hypothetical protein
MRGRLLYLLAGARVYLTNAAIIGFLLLVAWIIIRPLFALPDLE